jgi:hypothetical protein
MFGISIWDLLGIVAIICMVPTFFRIGRSRKPIWGALLCGIIISAIVGLTALIPGTFNWQLLKRILTVAILIGAIFWLVDILTGLAENKKE